MILIKLVLFNALYLVSSDIFVVGFYSERLSDAVQKESLVGCANTPLCSVALRACGSSNHDASTSEDDPVPVTVAQPTLTYHSVKTFRFTWSDVSNSNNTHYKLLENPDGVSGFTQVESDVPQGVERIDHIVPLYARTNAQYILQSCTDSVCVDSDVLSVSGTLVESIGNFKASNADERSGFGNAVSLSADGRTMAICGSGAVYLFTRRNSLWSQQANFKASNAASLMNTVSLSTDGNTLAVGASGESSNATGINGNQNDNSALRSGAAYVFIRNGGEWIQQGYIKANLRWTYTKEMTSGVPSSVNLSV